MPKPKPAAEPASLIGVREIAALLDRDKKTILRWARDGTLHAVYKQPGKNGAWLFDRAEVLALAAELRREEPWPASHALANGE